MQHNKPDEKILGVTRKMKEWIIKEENTNTIDFMTIPTPPNCHQDEVLVESYAIKMQSLNDGIEWINSASCNAGMQVERTSKMRAWGVRKTGYAAGKAPKYRVTSWNQSDQNPAELKAS